MTDEIFQDTYSVGQVAAHVGKHSNTIRGYAQKYGQFLSDGATPAEGEERRFNDADMEVLTTVAELKNQKKKHNTIIGYLSRGEYVAPSVVDSSPPEPSKEATVDEQPEKDVPTTEERALATLELLEQYAKPYIKRVTELEGKLDTAEEGWRGAEIRAATAEARLDGVYRRHWYQFWKPDKREEG